LFALNRLEQRFKIASAKSIVILSLYDLDEERGSVLNRSREDLQQITIVIVIDKDIVLL
jgi:hypothetical protein